MTNKLPEVGKRYRSKEHKLDQFEIAYIGRKSMCLVEPSGELSIQSLANFFEYYEELPEDSSNQVEDDRFTDVGKTIKKNKGCTERENEYFKAGWIAARDMFRASKEIEKAKEELQKQIKQIVDYTTGTMIPIEHITFDNNKQEIIDLIYKAQNPLKALDNIETQDEPVVGKVNNCKICNKEYKPHHAGDKYCSNYCKHKPKEALAGQNKQENPNTYRVEQASKLPWKDVRELPDNQMVIMKNRANYSRIGELYEDEFYFIEADDGENVISHRIAKGNIQKFITLTNLINSIESMLSRQDELEERINKLEKIII